jgi:hypothetical protein
LITTLCSRNPLPKPDRRSATNAEPLGLRRAYERDPEAVALWERETYPKLRKRAKRLGASIFFSDEAGFQSDPVLGRTYGLKIKSVETKLASQ